MLHYLENNKFYVMNEDEKLVYKVATYETFSGCTYLQVNLELVAGWDYVNPDYNNVQGWCPANRFVEDVQCEYILQYFLKEGMEEALEANGLTILEKINPSLQDIINKHNEA